MNYKIGSCCIWLTDTGETDAQFAFNSTTQSWLKRNPNLVEDRLWELASNNLHNLYAIVKHLSTLPEHLRMMRIGSEILPFYTVAEYKWFYDRSDVRISIESLLSKIGTLARQFDIRLSFHPGQYCVLGSDRSEVIDRSIEDIEYHAYLAAGMGYTKWHDCGFKINVHANGKFGIDGILAVLPRLSTTARNLISFENDEYSTGLDDILKLADHAAIVVDLHHDLIFTGQYRSSTDPVFDKIVDSWRGIRPVLHYSQYKPEFIVDQNELILPAHSKAKLRSHSDRLSHLAGMFYVAEFLPNFDVQVEAKDKNLASHEFANFVGGLY